MYPTVQKPVGTPASASVERFEHCNDAAGKVACPETLTFRTPDGTRLTVVEIGAGSSLKDLAHLLYHRGGQSTHAFPPIELGRSFGFSFGGRRYPADTRLSCIHEEINLTACGDVEYQTTGAKTVADKLKSGTGVEWRVVNENLVMFDSDPFEKKDQAAAFADKVLKKTPHFARLIEVEIKSMENRFYATMRVESAHSIRMIAEGIPIEISLAAPLIAQAVRTGDAAALGMLPLDVLSRMGMFLAPGLPGIDGYVSMQSEIEHAGQEYVEAPVFRHVAPVAANGIRESIAATASLLLRGVEKNARVSNAHLSSTGLTLYFSDALHAGKFIRTMKHAGYHAASLKWMQPNERRSACAAAICITDFNEVKRFVEATCGFAETSAKELFETAGKEMRLPYRFFIKELEAIGESRVPISLEKGKAAARRLMQDYLPCMDPAEAIELREAIRERSRPDQDGNTGSLQYLREKRGIGRVFSMNDYSDSVATFREVMGAIDELIAKA